MVRLTTRGLCWITVLMLAFASPALAGHHEAKGGTEANKGKGQGKAQTQGGEQTEAAGNKGKGPSAETRAKMAEAHEKLATCLRSTRPINECHSEMKKARQAAGYNAAHGAGHAAGHESGDCSCPHCDHDKGQCSKEESCSHSCHGGDHGDQHGDGKVKGKGKGKSDKAPSSTPSTSPTTGGPTQ